MIQGNGKRPSLGNGPCVLAPNSLLQCCLLNARYRGITGISQLKLELDVGPNVQAIPGLGLVQTNNLRSMPLQRRGKPRG